MTVFYSHHPQQVWDGFYSTWALLPQPPVLLLDAVPAPVWHECPAHAEDQHRGDEDDLCYHLFVFLGML